MRTRASSTSAVASEKGFQLLIDSVTDCALYMLDSEGRINSWNTGAQRLKGYRAEDILGQHFSLFYTEADRAAGEPQRTLDAARRNGKYETQGWRVRQDGSRFWAAVIIYRIQDEAGHLSGFAKVTRDLTTHQQMEQQLDESERRFQLLVQNIIDYAIFMLDSEGRVTNWNTGAERIKGYKADEIVGQHFSRFYTPEDRAAGVPARALATAEREGRYESEGWRLRKDGSRFWASAIIDPVRDEEGVLVGFAKITRDVTEQRNAEQKLEQARAELFQSQKMEALGQLTGGIAHDFNNLLTVIMNSLDLLYGSVREPRDIRLVDGAQRAAERGAKLTQQLLTFARRQPLRPGKHSLNGLIRGFEPVLHRACSELINLKLNLKPNLADVEVDAQQFEVTLLNLVVNACDAMPKGGTITVATDELYVEESSEVSSAVLKPGRYVVVTVTDTGRGMTPEVLAHAFEPFFTTKDVGKGTGLGLAHAYGFVAQSGGHAELRSKPGEGTSVVLYLPAVLDGRQAEADSGSSGSAGVVLVVEDETEVRSVAVEIFRSLGYDVLTADDGITALRVLKQRGDIDVLFTDVVMPRGINGLDLARQTRELRPDVRILLASGYPLPALAPDRRLNEEFSFISKPYRWTELVDKLRGLRERT